MQAVMFFSSRGRALLWFFLIAGIVLAGGWAVSSMLRADSPPTIQLVRPSYQDVSSSVTTNGKVLPIEDFQARAAFAGMVEKIYVHVGEKVHPGEMLIKLKDPFAASRYTNAVAGLDGAIVGDQNIRQGGSQEDLINLQGDLKRAEAERSDAQNRLDLLRRLQQEGNASAAEVADAERRLSLAQTTLQTLTQRSASRYSDKDIQSSAARVADARANLDTAKAVLANANIQSSIAGTVYSIPVSTYDFVPMGADLMQVADLNVVQIRAFFDEPDIGGLKIDQAVDVTWDAKPDRVWHGHIQRTPLTVFAQGPRMVGECIITVDDAKGDLLPNTDVTVKVILAKHDHVLTVPRAALHTDGAQRFVYRVVDGKAVRTEVHVGIVNLSMAEIASGLGENDMVAIDTATGSQAADGGISALRNGMKIRQMQ